MATLLENSFLALFLLRQAQQKLRRKFEMKSVREICHKAPVSTLVRLSKDDRQFEYIDVGNLIHRNQEIQQKKERNIKRALFFINVMIKIYS